MNSKRWRSRSFRRVRVERWRLRKLRVWRVREMDQWKRRSLYSSHRILYIRYVNLHSKRLDRYIYMYIQHYIYKIYCLQPTLSSANLSWSGTTGSRASCHECQWTFSLGLCPEISRMKGLRLVEICWFSGAYDDLDPPKFGGKRLAYIPIVPIRSWCVVGK